MRKRSFFFQKSSRAAGMAVSDRSIYEFADFRLIPEDNLLLRNGESIPLPPKAFSTLLLLLQNSGHLVRKEELIQQIWADAFVNDATVSRCVWVIRNALGEDSKSQQLIQTIPKLGYKFVADVSRFEQSAAASSSDHTGKLLPRLRTLQLGYIPALSVILIVVAAAFSIFVFYPWGTTLSEGKPVTIAVLPFRPVNTDKRDPIYELGMTETLINRLSTSDNFQVRSLSSVRQYLDSDTEPLHAGGEQRVDYVLAANYQVVDGKIRLTAQLVDARAGRTIESYDFLKDAPDAFTAQDAIVTELKDRLTARFGDRSVGTSAKRGTDNEEAYRYYILAQNFNELRGAENGRAALEQIDRAVALDPNFARAWATKAYIHRYMGYGPVAIEHSLKSIEAVDRALALDPNLSEAHSTLCFNKFRFEYDFEGAERACKRAIELDPNSPLAHKLYSNFLYTRGRFDEAISEIEKAIELQPVSYDNQQTYALALYFARRYADAEAEWKKLIPLNPNHRLIYGQLVRSLVLQGKEAEALEYLTKLLTLEKVDDETIRRIQGAFTESGWRGVTRERIRLGESQQNPPTIELARFHATVGNKDSAFKYLEKAYNERSNMIAVLDVDPELDRVRDDARYSELLRKVGSKARP